MDRPGRSEALVRSLLVRELETVTAYKEMIAKAKLPAVRALLERIARQEKHHIAEAMDLLSRLDAGQASALEAVGVSVGSAGAPDEVEEPAAEGAAAIARFEPSGRSVDVATGETLLGAALRHGIDVRHDCGGHGRCGTCRLQLASGTLSGITEPERTLLGEQLQAKWRLACQVRPLTDVAVVVPPNARKKEAARS